MKTFDQLLEVQRLGELEFSIEYPVGYMQGRAMFGGLLMGSMVKAFEAATPGRPLRSLTASLCGPVQPGPAQLRLEVLRAGSQMTTSTLKIIQQNEVLAQGTAVLGASRIEDREYVNLTPPDMTPLKNLERLEVAPPVAPEFTKTFVFHTDRHFPFSEETSGHALGYIAPENPGRQLDTAFLAGCIDAWWPAAFAREAMPRPMATVAFTFQPLTLPTTLPMLYRARTVAAHAGFTVEMRELWSTEGVLLALNQQTIAYIK
jgi:acyl-CoA thioesterase